MPGNSTNASNGSEAAGAAVPVGGGGKPGFVDQIVNGGLRGLDVALKAAGDVVRSVVPESVLDRIPFLAIDALGWFL